MAEPSSPTLYHVLGLRSDATTQDVRAAYRRLAQEHHPDRADPGGGDAMTRINHAYEVLSDADRRARYDQELLALRKPRRQRFRPALSVGLVRSTAIVLAGISAVTVLAGWMLLHNRPARVDRTPEPSDSQLAQDSGPAEPGLQLIPARRLEGWAPSRPGSTARAGSDGNTP
jgi:curved DNA-binding protein CbpA